MVPGQQPEAFSGYGTELEKGNAAGDGGGVVDIRSLNGLC
jgi:hypothetical protein